MKWETIQARAIREMVKEDPRDLANITERVEAIDIRNAGKLRELCPMAFPARLRKGPLVCFLGNNSDWVVEKKV